MEGFGLWITAAHQMQTAPVTLTGVRFTTRVTAVGQKTCVEQVFINREPGAIEAVYTFPLPEGAAVCGFEAITGERVLTGEIEELARGIEKYEDAVREGHGAFMAELWRPDVFSTRVGNLKPGQAVLIRLTYVAPVDIADRKLRLALPTTLAPRYGTSTGMDPVDAALEADALNPPHVLAVPYGLELAVEIDLGLKLKSVGSPTHGVCIEQDSARSATAWKVTLAARRTEMNRSVVLEAELAHENGAAAWTEEGLEPQEHFAAVSFLPEFEVTELSAVPAREVVFVLDCSGSMNGPSIEEAKRALALCLKCLNEGDRFNICRFGSTFELMKPESAAYTQATLDGALAYVAAIHANLGGTELFAPLQSVLAGTGERQLREIILLTDGQVTNEPALVQLAAGFRGRARIFSFGIGPASSEYLVKGIARATGGASDFVAPGERIEEKVLRMFGRMASPRLDDIRVSWTGAEADMEPQQINALFDGEPLRVAARLRGMLPREVTLTARWNGAEKQWTVPLTSADSDRHPSPPIPSARAESPAHFNTGLIAACWTRDRLAALESSAGAGLSDIERRDTIVALSKRYGILSKETTFIALEHRSLEDRTRGLPAQRRVPVMLAEGWGGQLLEEVGNLDGGKAWPCGAAAGAAFKPQSMPYPATPAPASPAPPASMDSLKSLKQTESRDAKSSAKTGIFNALMRGKRPAATAPRHNTPQGGDILQDLLMRQTAAGDFAWDALLDGPTINGHPWNASTHRQAVESRSAALHAADRPRVLATALTLRALEECFAAQSDLWQLAAAKARRWLAKTAPDVAAWCGKS